MKSMNDDNDKCPGFSLPAHMKMEAPAAICLGGFHSPFSVMPLKSDGSRCIMKPLSTSHTQVMAPNSSPKLEDFFGDATVETHQYGSHGTGTMVLSLDSMFYNQVPFKAQIGEDIQVQQQHHQYYSAAGIQYHDIYQTTDEQPDRETQLLGCKNPVPPMSEDAMTCLKTWVDHHALEQQVNPKMVGGGAMESLSLSMSPGSQSSCVTASRQISPTETEGLDMENRKRGHEKLKLKPKVHRKAIDSFGQRTSQYRGVTRHRWTGRYEAHLWDNSCKKEGQTRKGRQGGYDMEEKAARAYDLAAIKYWGPTTHVNFPLENYDNEVVQMENMSRQEFVAHLRRKSSGFSRGISMYRGVTRHHQHGRWQARIGRVAGNKDLYLGTFSKFPVASSDRTHDKQNFNFF
ncbi:AP2-like ethylene-responsive transcription factor ANT [Olea europaea subsp. europaea]|uniref:AP2-like ethylene-responsive transcription factor ANT n=1 Tax=Olea europaea subsp. europaea TaxID=158383 RepID=A0A8S0TBW5_OLEEU|nr:AP2-like ethylene-responsive transcription factor ANT [Olea europaea subsp. europaea]